MVWEYLVFNLIIFFSPLFFSQFYSKTIYPKVRHIFYPILIPALLFIIWDVLVTDYFWYFNSDFITGIKVFNLPFEEILFFFTVPFSTLFLWINFKKLFSGRQLNVIYPIIVSLFLFFTGLLFFNQKIYSLIVFILLPLVIYLDIFIFKTKLFISSNFLLFLIIVFLLTLVFNGYLTSRPIVTYNPLFKSNFNIWTVPLEDFIYGISLICLNLILYESQKSRR